MVKVRAELVNVRAETVFDVLNDQHYRKIWDKHITKVEEIGHIDSNSSVFYFSIGCPPPLRNRDFVVQSSWRVPEESREGGEYFIINHSVFHTDCPPRKDHIRGTSHLTGFLIRSTSNGCELGYLTHSNPGGKISAWLNNKVTTCFAPHYVKKLYKACLTYSEWKEKSNTPHSKPWLHPEQIMSKKIDIAGDCVVRDMETLEEEEVCVEEFEVLNSDFKEDTDSDSVSF